MSGLVLSLFPGADLLGLAFELEGFTVVTGPDVIFGRDVRNFHVPAGRFDGVIGGPPCQPFSPLVHLVRANGYEPKHGNLIPEFERLVAESACAWFLMEEVPQAPLPAVAGYAFHSFVLDNAALDAGQGIGLPQMRKRRFSFGVRGERAIDLRQWIQYAALELPEAGTPDLARRAVGASTGGTGVSGVSWKTPTVTADYDSGVNYGHEHTKQRTVRGKNDSNPQPWEIQKALAVTRDARPVPVAVGGSGKLKAEMSAPGNIRKRSWEECCALQGLPPDWLKDAPFTKAGKFMVLGNGVPLGTGRQIAQAVRRALSAPPARGQ